MALVPAKQVARLITKSALPANRVATILAQDGIPPDLVAEILADEIVTANQVVNLVINLQENREKKWLTIASLQTQALTRLHAKLKAAKRENMA